MLAVQYLEDQSEYSDIGSAVRSAVPHSIVLGDYIIEKNNAINTSDIRTPVHVTLCDRFN